MLRPYGSPARQGTPGSRKREQAPALHRILAPLNLECGGLPLLCGLKHVESATERNAAQGILLVAETDSEIACEVRTAIQMFQTGYLVSNAGRSSITVCGLMLACWTRSGPGLPVALCIAVTLCIPITLCVSFPLCILTSVRPRSALWPGLSLRSARAADGQQNQKTHTHK